MVFFKENISIGISFTPNCTHSQICIRICCINPVNPHFLRIKLLTTRYRLQIGVPKEFTRRVEAVPFVLKQNKVITFSINLKVQNQSQP